MTEYDKLVKLLELLEFGYNNNGKIVEYRKIYNNYDYSFKFYKTTKEVLLVMKFNQYKNIWNDYYYGLKSIDDCLKFINYKFKHLIRKQKINKLLNEPITKA